MSNVRSAVYCDSSDGIKCFVTTPASTEQCNQLSNDSTENLSDNATHVTIQLPQDTPGSTLNQQKLQELIAHLSQSGVIQMNEDSKIVIDLKTSDKPAEEPVAKAAKTSITTASRLPTASSNLFRNANNDVKFVPQVKIEATNRSRLQQPQQQQPTYFIVSAGQLSGTNNTHTQSSVGPIRLNQAGGTVGRVASNTTWISATSARLVTQGSDWTVANSPLMNVVSRSGTNAHLPGAIAAGGGNSRESSWQQYVKQFAKLGPCPICGDRISGYHYGIFCCESCKGFFKRTVQNGKRYACHHPNGSASCEVNVGSRKKCPACRFIKCIEKGMRIEAIRTDRTRGGRSSYPGSRYLRRVASRGDGSDMFSDQSGLKLHYSDDPDHLTGTIAGLSGVHHNLGPDGLPSSVDAGGGVYLDPAIFGQGDDDDDNKQGHLQMDQSAADYPGLNTPFVGRQVIVTGVADATGRKRIELPKVISEILSVEESVESESEDVLEIDANNVPAGTTIPEGVSEEEAAVYRALLNLADQRLYRTVRWARALPDFAQLDTDDQILLLQNCWADLLCLDCSWRSLPTPTEIRLTSSKCINLEAARELGAEEIVERMLHLTQYLTEVELDLVEYSCLKVIVLMQPDLKNLKAASQIRQYQDTVRQVLIDYIAKSSPSKSDKYSSLMARIPELQETSHTARLMLVDLDLTPYLSSNSLLMELLRSDIQRHAPTGNAALPSNEVGGDANHNEDTASPVATNEQMETAVSNAVDDPTQASIVITEGAVDDTPSEKLVPNDIQLKIDPTNSS